MFSNKLALAGVIAVGIGCAVHAQTLPIFVKPIQSPGILFNAVNTFNNQVDVGSHPTLQWERTQAWTGAVFLTMAAAPAGGGAAVIFTTSNQGTGNTFYTGYEWWVDPTCHQRMREINNIGGSNYLGVIGSANLCDSTRHKLAISYDGSSTVGGVVMYVDGNVDTSSSEGTTLSASIINNQPLFIGNQRGFAYSIGGKLEHFSLSNIVRNSAWVSAYKTAAASVDANTVLAYDFSEDSGKTTTDASANAFTAAVENATWEPSAFIGRAPFIMQGAISTDALSTPSSSISASFGANVTNNDTVAGAVYCACSTGLTVTDDKSNTYTVLGPNTGKTGVEYWQFYSQGIVNSPHIVTATLSSSTGTFWRLVADEVTNLSVGVDGSNITFTASPSGADSITSGSFTPGINNDFVYGASVNFGNGVGITQTSGTNYTIQQIRFASGGDNFWTEYLFQKTAATVAATFTPSVNATNGAVGSGIAFRTK